MDEQKEKKKLILAMRTDQRYRKRHGLFLDVSGGEC